MRQDAVLKEGVELFLDESRQLDASVLTSVCVMKLAACCCIRQHSVACSGR